MTQSCGVGVTGGRGLFWHTSLVNVGGEGAEGEVVKVTGRDQSLAPALLSACKRKQ